MSAMPAAVISMCWVTYVKYSDLGVSVVLNSATGTPLAAIWGPNMAAG